MKKCEYVNCNNFFEPTRTDQKYCSHNCSTARYWRDVAKHRVKRKVIEPKVCWVCGATFIPVNPQHARCKGPGCEIKKNLQRRGPKVGGSRKAKWKESLGGLTPAQALAQKYGLE